MKHEFTSEELIEFGEWWRKCIFIKPDGDNAIVMQCSQVPPGRHRWRECFTGTPSECAEFLVEQWRKEQVES